MRFASREMRAGLRGFIIFFCCILLGVVAIAGVSGISSMIEDEFSLQGRTLLGGDLRITMMQDRANDAEIAAFTAQGRVATSIWMRSMMRTVENETASRQQLVEIKAIDDIYPLYGRFETMPTADFDTLFAAQDGVFGVVLASSLLQRLEVNIGDRVEIGNQVFAIRGVVVNESDLLSEGLQLGLRVFMARDALAASDLLQQGSLYAEIYKIAMPTTSDAELTKFSEQLKQNFPSKSWNIRVRSQAAPALEVNIKRFLQFLTLVGLTALIVGGTGVAQAVNTYLDKKREVIAIFKTLGASGSFVSMLYLSQIMMISLLSIIIGLGVAAFMPALLKQILQSFLPMSEGFVFYPASLLKGAAFACLSVLAFALIPLGRASNIHVSGLFRSSTIKNLAKTPIIYRLVSIFLLFLIAGGAIGLRGDHRLAVQDIDMRIQRRLRGLVQQLPRLFGLLRAVPVRRKMIGQVPDRGQVSVQYVPHARGILGAEFAQRHRLPAQVCIPFHRPAAHLLGRGVQVGRARRQVAAQEALQLRVPGQRRGSVVVRQAGDTFHTDEILAQSTAQMNVNNVTAG